jgi:hypothetical protein
VLSRSKTTKEGTEPRDVVEQLPVNDIDPLRVTKAEARHTSSGNRRASGIHKRVASIVATKELRFGIDGQTGEKERSVHLCFLLFTTFSYQRGERQLQR